MLLEPLQEKEGDANDDSSSSDDDARKRNHLGAAKHRKRHQQHVHRVKYKLAVLEHVVGGYGAIGCGGARGPEPDLSLEVEKVSSTLACVAM